jgi:hypothetical protein
MEPSPATQPDAGRCPLCGNPNNCQLCTLAAYKGPCWCARANIPEALIARVPSELRNKSCICRDCVEKFHRTKDDPSKFVKITSADFYFDAGLMVFTADYHLRRGSCCGNNCRHCPY